MGMKMNDNNGINTAASPVAIVKPGSYGTGQKDVIEISIGGYHMTMDAEKMSILNGLSNGNSREFRQIQELTEWVLDLCCGLTSCDEDCLKYLKYLTNLRGAFELLRSLGVTVEKGGAA